MSSLLRFFRRLLNVLRPHGRDADLVREIAAHVTLLEDEYRRRGLSPDEAHRQARVTLGGIERAKDLHRAARSFRPSTMRYATCVIPCGCWAREPLA